LTSEVVTPKKRATDAPEYPNLFTATRQNTFRAPTTGCLRSPPRIFCPSTPSFFDIFDNKVSRLQTLPLHPNVSFAFSSASDNNYSMNSPLPKIRSSETLFSPLFKFHCQY
jgi:hypothetical protein